MARELILIAMGGAIGAVSRYLVSTGAQRLTGETFPWGTLVVNVVGCFLLGLAAEFGLARRDFPLHVQRGFTVGFLGALTTYSTFGHETFRHLEDGKWALALSNMGANMVLGLLAVWLGVMTGKALFR